MPDEGHRVFKFKANGEKINNHHNRSVRRRNRQPLSCQPCRGRRSRCDRGRPCKTCIDRGEADHCFYQATSVHQQSVNGPVESTSQVQDPKDRLQRLEELVKAMVQASSISPSKDPSLESPQLQSPDSLISTDESARRDSGIPHWSAILNSIHDLKADMVPDSADTSSIDEGQDIPEPILLLAGGPGRLSLSQILDQYLPPKIQVDRRLSMYFNATYMVIPVIHAPKFQSEYEKFWETPSTADPIWIALLFSILGLSANISHLSGAEADVNIRDNFLAAAAQCLNLQGYTYPKKNVVEALLLFCQCKYMGTLDPSREVGLIIAIAIRLAYHMNLHREPASPISPFEAELRRRVWVMCRHFDIQFSSQFGVPPVVAPGCEDVKPPRNLLDADLTMDMTELPAPRPETEVTPVMYFVIKARLMQVLAPIYQRALSVQPITQFELTAFDKEIRQQHDALPVALKIRPMSKSFADPSHLIMTRLNCEFLVQKSLCILHRKSMANGNQYSRRVCVDASIAIVELVTELYVEFQPNGHLQGRSWMFTSTLVNDFLLATMTLCLVLFTEQKASKDDPATASLSEELRARFETLKKSLGVCHELRSRSRGARRVADALQVMLPRLEEGLYSGKSTTNGHISDSIIRLTNPSSTIEEVGSKPQNAFVPDIPDAFAAYGEDATLNSVDTVFNDSLDIDWQAFDQYINNWDMI